MKRAISFIIIFILFALLYQYTVVYLQNGHDVKYEIEIDDKVFYIEENYKKNEDENRYMFYVTTDKNNEYIYNIDNKYNKQKKIIKEIKYYEKDGYLCIYPITDFSKEDFEIQCSDGKSTYSYDYVNKKVDISSFLNEVKNKNKYKNILDVVVKEDNTIYYKNNFYANEYLSLYKYKYVNIFNNNRVSKVVFSETDKYYNDYIVYIDNYILIPLVNEKTNEIIKYISINTLEQRLETIILETTLSSNIYNIGVANKKLYVFDLKNKKEFAISPLGGYDVIGTVETGFKIFEDGKWVSKSVTEFTKNRIKIDNTPKVNLKYEYDYIYESNKSYFIINDNKVYRIYKDNLDGRVLLFELNNYKNLKVTNERVYFIENNTLYRYDQFGIKNLVNYNEFKYNNQNIYNVYNK